MALFGDAGFEIDLADIDSVESSYLKTWISLYNKVRDLLPQVIYTDLVQIMISVRCK